jgi:hypothetical protein
MSGQDSGLKKAASAGMMVPGGLMLLFSLTIAAVGVTEIVQGKTTPGTYGALVLLLGLGTTGAWLLRRGHQGLKDAEASQERGKEVALLKALASQGGRATVAEICVKLDLRPSEAEALADQLARQGQLEVLVSPDGIVVYEARGLISSEEKRQATGLPGLRVQDTKTDTPQALREAPPLDDEALAAAHEAHEASAVRPPGRAAR